MSRKKGGRTRRKVEQYYREQGYLVTNVEKTGKFVKEKDLFALALGEEYKDSGFDIVCLKKGTILLVQVKTNNPATRKFYLKFAEQYASEQIHVICATWYDRKGLRIQRYMPDGTIIETDLRQ